MTDDPQEDGLVQPPLTQDNDSPFSPPDPANPDPVDAQGATTTDNGSTLDDTHPATDSNIQPEETYDEGLSGAAEAQEPSTSSSDGVGAQTSDPAISPDDQNSETP